jgi:hypothetical protein
VVGDTARADRADDRALCHGSPAPDLDRAKVHQRRRVAKGRLDRHRLAAGGHGAGERDDAPHRGAHVRPRRRAEIDAAMLPACVRMRTIEREGTKDWAVDGPCPRVGGCREHEGAERRNTESPNHETSFVARLEN